TSVDGGGLGRAARRHSRGGLPLRRSARNRGGRRRNPVNAANARRGANPGKGSLSWSSSRSEIPVPPPDQAGDEGRKQRHKQPVKPADQPAVLRRMQQRPGRQTGFGKPGRGQRAGDGFVQGHFLLNRKSTRLNSSHVKIS